MRPPIKRCPFCSCRDISVDTLGTEDRIFYAVRCDDCEATGPLSQSYDGAVEAWNIRRADTGGDGH
jgi:Lar family restriction alleviation protein